MQAIYIFFYRVKNDSNDDCRYGAFRDGDNCKGNLENINQNNHANTHIKYITVTVFLKKLCREKYLHSISCNLNVVTHRLPCWVYWRQLL